MDRVVTRALNANAEANANHLTMDRTEQLTGLE